MCFVAAAPQRFRTQGRRCAAPYLGKGLPLPAGPSSHAGPPPCSHAWGHYHTKGCCYANVRSAAIAATSLLCRVRAANASLHHRTVAHYERGHRRVAAGLSSPFRLRIIALSCMGPLRRRAATSGGLPMRRAVASSSARQPSPSRVVPLPPPHRRAVMRGATHRRAVVHGAANCHATPLRCRAAHGATIASAPSGAGTLLGHANASPPCFRPPLRCRATTPLRVGPPPRRPATEPSCGAGTATEPPRCCTLSRRGPAVALTDIGPPSPHRAVLSRAAATAPDYRAVA